MVCNFKNKLLHTSKQHRKYEASREIQIDQLLNYDKCTVPLIGNSTKTTQRMHPSRIYAAFTPVLRIAKYNLRTPFQLYINLPRGSRRKNALLFTQQLLVVL